MTYGAIYLFIITQPSERSYFKIITVYLILLLTIGYCIYIKNYFICERTLILIYTL